MKIPSIITSDGLESLYDDIDAKEVNLPRTFQRLRLGLLPRLSQFFITLLKRNSSASIKFFQLDAEDSKGIEKLLSDPHSLTAVLMAENVFGKSIDNEKIELKSKVNKALQQRLDESIHKRGHRLQLFAVDHSAWKYAFPNCFYIPEGTNALRQSEYYSKLIERFVGSSAKLSSLTGDETDSLGELLFELVENTEQHGKQDYTSGSSERSVRGLVVDYKLITDAQESESIGGKDTVITAYLDGIRANKQTIHLLEISIFDSGSGVAKNLTSSNSLTIYEKDSEASIVSKSFAKGVTSKSDSKGYGRGLHNVRKVLSDRKGFISVRTGCVSLFRDFNQKPLVEDDDIPLALFDDNNEVVNDNRKELNSVEGLAYSILVPLK